MTPTTDVVDDQEAQAALNKARKKRARFNFGMVGIEAGAELQFHYRGILNDGQPFAAEVVSRTTILFEGQETSLSAAASTIMQRHGVTWTAKWSPLGSLALVLRGRVAGRAGERWRTKVATSKRRAEAGIVAAH